LLSCKVIETSIPTPDCARPPDNPSRPAEPATFFILMRLNEFNGAVWDFTDFSGVWNRGSAAADSLNLSWADAVSNDCTPHAERFLHSLRRVSCSLVLHFGIELGSDQDDHNRKPDPDHEPNAGP
jgi:hypothetical protein